MEARHSRARRGVAAALAVFVSAAALSACASAPDMGKALLGEIEDLGGGRSAFRGSTLDRSGPIPVLVLEGTPYERGFAYGMLLRDDALRMADEILALKEEMLSRYSWIERAFAPSAIWRELDEFARATPERYVQEMKGFAEATGIAYGDVLFAQAGAGLFRCAAFFARSSTGGVLHGRNFDYYPRALGENPVLVRYADEGGVKYWNLSAIGYLASFNGWNDEGITVTLNAGGSGEETPGWMPTGWKLRELLSRSRTLADAKYLLLATPCDAQSWIVAVSSAQEGAGMVFDLEGDDRAFFPWKGGKPLAVFNRPFGDGRHEADGLAKKRLPLLVALDECNVERMRAAERFFATRPLAEPADMWALLRDRSFPIPDLMATANGSVANENTLLSMVFDLGYGQVFVAHGPSWAPLRTVWRFDPWSMKFSKYLDPDPFVTSEAFAAFERAMIAYERGPVEGKPYPTPPANPYLAGWYGGTAELDRARLTELEAAAKAWPRCPLARLMYGYALRAKDRAKAIEEFEATLSIEWAAVPWRLYALRQLALLRGANDDAAGAAGAAREWLALVRRHEAAFSTEGWIDSIRPDMEALAGK